MASSNGVAPHTEEAVAVADQPQEPEPQDEAPQAPTLTATSMDYWRQMTQRQVDRLQDRVDELEAEAGPLRQQIQALKLALSAVAPGPAPVDYKHKGLPITEQEKALVAAMVGQHKTTEEIRERLPHVKPGTMYSAIYAARSKLQREALR